MKLKLIYTHESVSKPLLAEAILKTGFIVNILDARVTPTTGEIVIDVQAVGEKATEFIELLQREGCNVTQIAKFLEFDRDRCICCGACVSLCPVGAIRQDKDWQIYLDDSKCIGCRLCVNACPMYVIKVF